MARYLYFRKWFYQNLPLSIAALALFIYLRFFETDEKFAFLILPVFIIWMSTVWWGITAFVGMRNAKKRNVREERKKFKAKENKN